MCAVGEQSRIDTLFWDIVESHHLRLWCIIAVTFDLTVLLHETVTFPEKRCDPLQVFADQLNL